MDRVTRINYLTASPVLDGRPHGAAAEQPGKFDRKGRILIAEDEGIIAADLADSLERLGYEIVGLAQSTREAVDTASQCRPDAVVMDVHFEGDDMDGIDAAKSIVELCGAKVVFLTAHTEPEIITRAMELGPLTLLIKPVAGEDLAQSLDAVLESSPLPVQPQARISEESMQGQPKVHKLAQ